MALKKFDGVIEAVHYKDGKLNRLRVYERRGATWSDRLIVSRDQLIDRLKNKQKFVTGSRERFLAGSFEASKDVQLVTHDGSEFIATRSDATQDELEGVPFF